MPYHLGTEPRLSHPTYAALFSALNSTRHEETPALFTPGKDLTLRNPQLLHTITRGCRVTLDGSACVPAAASIVRKLAGAANKRVQKFF